MECRGTGDSEHKGPFTIEQYALDVVALLDHLGIDRVTFAGHSMGGGVGYQLAAHHESRLERLVLMAPIGSSGTASPENAARWRANPGSYTPRAPQPTASDHATELAMYRANALHPANTDAWFEHRIECRRTCGHYVESGLSMATLDLQAALPKITVPVLMLAGSADGLLPVNIRDFELMSKVACLHVVSHAGHDVARHAPEETALAMHKFMIWGAKNYHMSAKY